MQLVNQTDQPQSVDAAVFGIFCCHYHNNCVIINKPSKKISKYKIRLTYGGTPQNKNLKIYQFFVHSFIYDSYTK